MSASRTNFITPDSVNSILTSSETSALRRLVEGCRRYRVLAVRLQALLPEELAHHCTFGNLNGDELVMVVASAAWATRLKYTSEQLIRHCNQHFGINVRRLSIKIDGALFMGPRAEEEPVREAALSPAAHRCVRESLAGCSDPVLREFLERLDQIAKAR